MLEAIQNAFNQIIMPSARNVINNALNLGAFNQIDTPTLIREVHSGLSTPFGSADGTHFANALARNPDVSALMEGFLLSKAATTSSIIFCNVVCK